MAEKMNFNDYQLKAINDCGNCTCIATAGSGKTTVLVERVAKLAKETEPKRILCVAFNNDAVNNMKNRLEKKNIALKAVEVTTLHSFATAVVRESGAKFTIVTKDFNTMNYKTGRIMEYGVIDLMNEVIKKYAMDVNTHKQNVTEMMVKYAGIRLSTMKPHTDELEDYEEYFEPAILNVIVKKYVELLESKNLLPFDMMCWKARRLLKLNPELCEKIQSKYDYVLIDECQDLSKDQYEMIKLVSANAKLFMVGDGLQSIYNFRGSDSQLLLQAHKDIADMRVIHLPINYRCSDAIVKASNKIARITDEADDENYMDAVADNKGGNKPKIVFTGNAGNTVSKYLMDFEQETKDWSNLAILARTNAVLLRLKSALYKNKIPCYLNEKKGIPVELKIVNDYVQLINNPNDDKAFLKTINTPFRYISKAVLAKTEEIAAKRKYSMFDAIMYALGRKDRCYFNALDFIEDVERIRKRRYKNVSDALKDIISRMKIEDAIKKQYEGKTEEYEDAMENLAVLIEDAAEYKNLKEYGEYLSGVINSEDLGGVTLSTIHKAKGLEWDKVIIADFNEGMFPHKKSTNIQEEIHILYVAVTRAKSDLVLVVNNSSPESPFLEAFEDTVEIINKPKKKSEESWI